MDAMSSRAEQQYGLITRAQARDLGVSDSAIDRRVASGRLIVVHPGVYRFPGAPVTSHQRALAAAFWTGGLVSHASAGRLWRLEGVMSDGLHLTIAYERIRRDEEITVHRTVSLPDIDRRFVDGIPCTSATRTLIDLAPSVDDETLEAAMECARRMGLTTLTLMGRRADALCGRGRPGSQRIRRVLSAAEGRALESRLEVKARRLLHASALPRPVAQYSLGRFRLDFAWPRLQVAVECDGFEHHGSRLQWKRDRRRVAAIEAMGWRLVHLTWDDVTRCPGESIERVASALRLAAAAA